MASSTTLEDVFFGPDCALRHLCLFSRSKRVPIQRLLPPKDCFGSAISYVLLVSAILMKGSIDIDIALQAWIPCSGNTFGKARRAGCLFLIQA